MKNYTKPILFPIDSALEVSPGLVTATKLAILYQAPLRIVYIADKVIEPSIPVRKNGRIVGVQAQANSEIENIMEKLDFLCSDLKVRYPLLEDCDAIFREGFMERELINVIQESNPRWTVWSNTKEVSDLENMIYNLAVCKGKINAYPLLILSDNVELFPPETIHFYFSEGGIESKSIDMVNELAKLLQAGVRMVEVKDSLSPQDFSQAQKIEADLQVRFGNKDLAFTRMVFEEFLFQIHTPHSGIQNFTILDHLDQSLLTKEIHDTSTREVLETTQNPVLIV